MRGLTFPGGREVTFVEFPDLTPGLRDHYDVVVVGAGAAGLAAASTAAALGHSVIVVEASNRVGGTTAISGGMIWIPANRRMAQAGIADSLDAARDYLRALVPGFETGRAMAAFLARGDEALRFLEANTALRLQPVRRYPDYYPDLPGATAGGRVLEPVPFDGRLLGSDFERLRDPLPEFTLFGGMMISREDLPVLRRAGRSLPALWHTTKLVARYAAQRLRAHRGTRLVLGNALAARLFKSARDLGVEIALETAAVHLVVDGGRVSGLVVRGREGERTLQAQAGVILATGGISHYPDLRSHYMPPAAGDRSTMVRSGAERSGAHVARDAGAALSADAASVDGALAFWVPASRFRRPDGSEAFFPHTVMDRAKPGLIALDGDGRRFVNEAVSYHEFGRAQLRDPQRRIPAWLICDRRFLWRYGLGRVRPFALSTAGEERSGYLRRGATLAALMAGIGLPVDTALATIDRYNEFARNGEDPEFGRGSNIYQRHLGDADWKPNPCVAPIADAPFFAVAVEPADLGMAGGIVTDEHARVLRADGGAIPGLYACGNDMQSIMNGAYPGPGITLGPALVFGYLSAMHACSGQ
ncbi:MAG: FAD-dependent oxidoreductase [Betaproteobacteria bacterium]|nr:FAD-dependent oxidoreductase [Betaproteobacteria bacterium]